MSDRIGSKNLPLLQSLIKKDPESYKSDFIEVFSEFNAIWNTYLLNSSSHEEDLVTMAMFIAQVSHCYKDLTNDFSTQIINLLSNQGPLLDADMRLTLCRALILMRNKNLIPAVTVLQLFFNLFRCPDKILRNTLRNYIVQDVKNINKKGRNVQLNSALQNYMYIMLKDNNNIAAKISLDIVIELYNRKIWNNDKTANVISTGLFSKNNKLVVAALKFFLGSENAQDDDSDSDDDAGHTDKRSSKELMLAYRVGKKTKKREKRMKRALDMIQDQKKKRKKVNSNFSAIHLLNDPQDLAEKLFAQVDRSKTNDLFEVKVLKLNFISQLIGVHKLILLQFYPFFDRFLKPSQREVTKLLLFLAQACHDIVPPDIIEKSIQTIANNFITERNSNEVMAVGLNAIREICNRCPLAMGEDLLHDLVLFKKNKDKCVSMAAQSLIGLFRVKNPQLLHRSFRGKPTVSMQELKVLNYGELDAKDYIAGAEVLPDNDDADKGEEPGEESDGWQSCSDDNDDEDNDDGSWVDVSHSSDDNDNNKDIETTELTKEEKIEKSQKLMESRILTQDDFKRIQQTQLDKEKEFSRKTSRKRKKMDGDCGDGGDDKELLPLSQIEGVYKKRKHDKESRLATVMAGREGREKFGTRKKKSNPHASTSNASKSKKKNFQMLRPKLIKKKNKATFHEKKEALKKVLLRKLNKQK